MEVTPRELVGWRGTFVSCNTSAVVNFSYSVCIATTEEKIFHILKFGSLFNSSLPLIFYH